MSTTEQSLKSKLSIVDTTSLESPVERKENSEIFAQTTSIDFPSATKASLDACAIIANDQINDWTDSKETLSRLKKNLDYANSYINSDHCNLNQAVYILNNFCRNFHSDRFDYVWRHEEKHTYFKETILNITKKIEKLLKETKVTSLNEICSAVYYLSLWDFKPNLPFIELCLKRVQTFSVHTIQSTPENIFRLFDGLTRLNYPLAEVFHENFLIDAIEVALPLLTNRKVRIESTKIKMNENYEDRLAIFIKHYVLQLLLDVTKSNYSEFIHDKMMPIIMHFTLKVISAKKTNKLISSFKKDRLYRLFIELVGMQFSNQNADQFLDPNTDIEYTIEDESVQEEFPVFNRVYFMEAVSKEKNVASHPTLTYFEINTFKEHFKFLIESGNYKGFNWYLKAYCRTILHSQSTNYKITYTPQHIDVFLKIIRNAACDIKNDPIIINAFKFLFREAIAPYNMNLIGNQKDILLNILWMNMVLSTALNDGKLAFTRQEQTQVFSRLSALPQNETQARALYEIQTMGWHGEKRFTKEQTEAMRKHFLSFNKSSHPSEDEIEWYNKIYQELDPKVNKDLKHDHICKRTGHEIDIAYPPSKLAIHIDGPSHFRNETGSKTIKTLFRNHCLKRAGWTSIDVSLLISSQEQKKILDTIIDTINKVGTRRPAQDRSTLAASHATTSTPISSSSTISLMPGLQQLHNGKPKKAEQSLKANNSSLVHTSGKRSRNKKKKYKVKP